jgi:hypothetical protein
VAKGYVIHRVKFRNLPDYMIGLVGKLQSELDRFMKQINSLTEPPSPQSMLNLYQREQLLLTPLIVSHLTLIVRELITCKEKAWAHSSTNSYNRLPASPASPYILILNRYRRRTCDTS